MGRQHFLDGFHDAHRAARPTEHDSRAGAFVGRGDRRPGGAARRTVPDLYPPAASVRGAAQTARLSRRRAAEFARAADRQSHRRAALERALSLVRAGASLARGGDFGRRDRRDQRAHDAGSCRSARAHLPCGRLRAARRQDAERGGLRRGETRARRERSHRPHHADRQFLHDVPQRQRLRSHPASRQSDTVEGIKNHALRDAHSRDRRARGPQMGGDRTAAGGPGEVRLRQHAAGLNYADINLRRGGFYLYAPPKLPTILGNEAAGTVEALGPGVTQVKVGDRVAYVSPSGMYDEPPGGYAEARNIAADRLVILPDGVSERQAAAIMAKGLTASTILHRLYTITPGDVVLIHAAAGGMGTILTQWSK